MFITTSIRVTDSCFNANKTDCCSQSAKYKVRYGAAELRAAAAGPGFAAQFITPFTQFRMENFC